MIEKSQCKLRFPLEFPVKEPESRSGFGQGREVSMGNNDNRLPSISSQRETDHISSFYPWSSCSAWNQSPSLSMPPLYYPHGHLFLSNPYRMATLHILICYLNCDNNFILFKYLMATHLCCLLLCLNVCLFGI